MASSIIDSIVFDGSDASLLKVFPMSLGKSFIVDIGKAIILAKIAPKTVMKNEGISIYVANPAPPDIIPSPIAANAPTRPMTVAKSIYTIPLFFLCLLAILLVFYIQ